MIAKMIQNIRKRMEAKIEKMQGKFTKAYKRLGFDPWVEKIPWRRKWQPTPVFLPENSMDRGAWQATVPGVAKSWT